MTQQGWSYPPTRLPKVQHVNFVSEAHNFDEKTKLVDGLTGSTPEAIPGYKVDTYSTSTFCSQSGNIGFRAIGAPAKKKLRFFEKGEGSILTSKQARKVQE